MNLTFDHVPRSLLLKKLVKLGIGKCMLFALKQLYSFSICVINYQGELSSSFRMERGVRQGAGSSVLLFITFMDGLFQHLEETCSLETLLSDIHTLVHADDAIILSTDRLKFIQKCNELLRFFDMHHFKLNLGKSDYFIINPKENDVKHSIILESGFLKYKSEIEYLGVIVTDIGVIVTDIGVIVTDIGVIVTDIGVIVTDIDVIFTDIGVIVTDIGVIVTDIGVIVTDIGVIVTDIGVIVTDIDVIVTDIGVIVTDIGVIVTDIGVIVTDIGVIVTDIGVIVMDIGSIKHNVQLYVNKKRPNKIYQLL